MLIIRAALQVKCSLTPDSAGVTNRCFCLSRVKQVESVFEKCKYLFRGKTLYHTTKYVHSVTFSTHKTLVPAWLSQCSCVLVFISACIPFQCVCVTQLLVTSSPRKKINRVFSSEVCPCGFSLICVYVYLRRASSVCLAVHVQMC